MLFSSILICVGGGLTEVVTTNGGSCLRTLSPHRTFIVPAEGKTAIGGGPWVVEVFEDGREIDEIKGTQADSVFRLDCVLQREMVAFV